MKKKILSLVLVAAMLSSLFVIAPVSGATEAAVTVETSDAIGVKGETVSVDIIMKSATPIYGYQLAYEYDTSKLQLDGVKWGIAGGSGSLSNKTGTLKDHLAQGPYDIINQTYSSAFDASAGIVIATLHFTALEDGAAYVAIRNIYGVEGYVVNRAYTTANYKSYFSGEEIACADANTVAIYPEGSIAPSAARPGDFTGSATGTTINAYNGSSTGTVVVPSQMPKRVGSGFGTVTSIADSAFGENVKFSKLILPASVSQIGELVVFNSVQNLKVVVLNPDAVFTDLAFYSEIGKITICGYAGSTAEAYAKAEKLAFEELSLCNNMTIDGTTILVPATTTAPGMMENADGELVVAWTDGTNTYLPGQAMNLTGDVTLTAAKTVAKPTTSTDIDFKLAAFYEEGTTNRVENSDLSMRFKASFSIEDYATLAQLGTVKLGMLITPAKYVSLAGSFTKEALATLKTANAYVDVNMTGYYEKTATDYIFAARLANFSSATLAKNPDFAAVMYATVTAADGTTFTVYGNFNLAANRNVKSVAQAIYDNTALGLTNTQKGWLNDLIGSFN